MIAFTYWLFQYFNHHLITSKIGHFPFHLMGEIIDSQSQWQNFHCFHKTGISYFLSLCSLTIISQKALIQVPMWIQRQLLSTPSLLKKKPVLICIWQVHVLTEICRLQPKILNSTVSVAERNLKWSPNWNKLTWEWPQSMMRTVPFYRYFSIFCIAGM